MKTTKYLMLAVLVVLGLAVPALAASLYRVTDLGTLNGGGNPNPAYDINNAGQIVGLNDTQAFLWTSEGGMQDLGHLPGGDYSEPWGINSSGQIVGRTQRSFFDASAFLWTNGVMQDLGDLPGGIDYSEAYDINDTGQVVGWSYAANNRINAFLWSSATGMQNLGDLGGGSYAYGINNSGQVVGYSSLIGGNHAFLWTSEGGMQDLGVLPGAGDFPLSIARDINDNGQVVGHSDAATGQRAFLWTSDTGMQDLGALPGLADSDARGINNHGHVVGWGLDCCGDLTPNHRAFIWISTEGMRELNDLLHPADSSWIIHEAYAINDAGQIVGAGTNPDGLPRPYLLTPIPEPASFTLLLLAAGGLLAGPRCRGAAKTVAEIGPPICWASANQQRRPNQRPITHK